MKKLEKYSETQGKDITNKNAKVHSGGPLSREVKKGKAEDSRGVFSNYDFNSFSFRSVLAIPVKGVQILQENVFPSILLTEGYHAFSKNFGLSRDKAWNNFLLGGIVTCTLSNFWINPWLDDEHASINAIWNQVTNTSISTAEYNAQFYSAVGKYAVALGMHVFFEIIEHICGFLLSTAITFKRQYEFVLKWLSNFSAYGLNASNISSGTENDEEKANLNPIKLFLDIENQELLVSLWCSRVGTIINCITALYALTTMSPPLVISIYLTSIILPKFIVLSVAYSMSLNLVLQIFEKPMHYFYEKMMHFKDRLIRQITNVDVNAELISFLDGEEFEAKKLLNLLELERSNALKYDFLNSLKMSIDVFVNHFEWLVPIIASVPDVREGKMNRELVGPLMDNYFRINKFLKWSKENFTKLERLEESTRRLKLYGERIEAWQAKRVEIDRKIKDSQEIGFNGQIYADEKQETLLAKGGFILPKGSITHIDGPSGVGKTTLFRVFGGLWNDFDGECNLPKKKTELLPSQSYILGADEPLFQTVCYPRKFDEKELALNESEKENIEFIKEVFQVLNLPERIYNNLTRLSVSKSEEINLLNAANWMTSLSDGERKRVAFGNILLKLRTREIQFLIMDEPFKGIDYQIQIKMADLLLSTIKKSELSKGCTILFSNHEQNHGLNTHVLKIDEETKAYDFREKEK